MARHYQNRLTDPQLASAEAIAEFSLSSLEKHKEAANTQSKRISRSQHFFPRGDDGDSIKLQLTVTTTGGLQSTEMTIDWAGGLQSMTTTTGWVQSTATAIRAFNRQVGGGSTMFGGACFA